MNIPFVENRGGVDIDDDEDENETEIEYKRMMFLGKKIQGMILLCQKEISV
jgi:hypothetical protein